MPQKKVTKQPQKSKTKRVAAASAQKKTKAQKQPPKKPANVFSNLRKWNISLAVLHAVQALIIVVIARDVSVPVSTEFLTLNPLATEATGQPVLVQATKSLFEVNLAYLVAVFFVMSAVAHTIMATVYRKSYETNLKLGVNKARWIEYAASASTMIVAIALLSGVYSLSLLITLFGLIAIMNLMGLVMEVHNQTTKTTNWLSYVIGCLAGILPWVVLAIYLWGAGIFGAGQVPTFVYWIYGSLFVFFNLFAINMYLQYKKVGRWADYMYGEKVYMILSLVAKSALAWQVFFGTLRP